MARTHNFCAGPAALPEAVLERARDELLDWHGVGASIMEMSHRSAEFVSVIEGAKDALCRLLNIPDDYTVLFLHGGATQQFSAIPLNLAQADDVADFVVTGRWSEKALLEGERLLDARVVARVGGEECITVPEQSTWALGNAAYVYYCSNETIDGLEFSWIPEVSVPLVADMSSTLLSRPLDVSKFGVIFAGAQKNIGPAGLGIVIVDNAILGRARKGCPAVLNWQIAADNDSMYNTPATFSIYLAGLVFDWLEEQGGLNAIEAINRRKAKRLYELIDASDFYNNRVEVRSRSLMNVPFTLANTALDSAFLSEAKEHGLLNLRGHRSAGGMRASIYNAVSETSVEALCGFMSDFEKRYG